MPQPLQPDLGHILSHQRGPEQHLPLFMHDHPRLARVPVREELLLANAGETALQLFRCGQKDRRTSSAWDACSGLCSGSPGGRSVYGRGGSCTYVERQELVVEEGAWKRYDATKRAGLSVSVQVVGRRLEEEQTVWAMEIVDGTLRAYDVQYEV
ncbi:hypothetical protein CALVIDRAFT_567602 [Calocera viscosa TUFC12733]|uniref:Uncharacterized protein n=1 Tax=Calocera viscosa (strain TUFC12733) TaxID=1330018 RepID=A0A167I1C6_CALVF|nr:hypothetical protein CALVIDRAFT_567602 [Calocera viscosa TUFC12733]